MQDTTPRPQYGVPVSLEQHLITTREASKEKSRSLEREKGSLLANCYCTFCSTHRAGRTQRWRSPPSREARSRTHAMRWDPDAYWQLFFFLFLLLEGGGSCMQVGPRPGRCTTTLSLALRDVYLDFPLGQSGRFFLWLEKFSTFFCSFTLLSMS